MIKKILFFVLLCVLSVSGVKYHQDSRGAEIHTPFRWIVADSTAKAALSLAVADTQKFCFQLSDTSIWCLIDNSPLKWAYISGKKADSLYLRTFLAVTAGITRMNVDTSKIRAAVVDTLSVTIIKSAKTIRDTTTFTGGAYFTGIARFAGTLYAPVVDIDSMAGDVKTGGSIGQYRGSSYLKLDYNQGSLPGYPANYYPTIKSDAASIYYACFDRIVGSIGFLYNKAYFWLYDSVASDFTVKLYSNGMSYFGPLTTTTLNTGIPDAAELYPMDQAVRTTDDPTFDSNTVTDLKVLDDATIDDDLSVGGGITIAGGTQITKCVTGTFQCSLFDNTTYRAVVTAKYSVFGSVGNYVRRIYFPSLQGVISSGTAELKGFPSDLIDISQTCRPIVYIYNNNSSVVGVISVGSAGNGVYIIPVTGSLSGVCGIVETSIVY